MDAFGADVGDRERVEDGLGVHFGAEFHEAVGEEGGEEFDAARDFFQAVGAVVDGIHRRHDGEEDLGGADVGRGLVAADVLLARAEGEAHGGVAGVVLGDPDEAAGHLAFEGVLGGEETGVRSAEAERDAEALGGADGDIGAEFAGGAEQGECEEIGGDDGERAGGVGGDEEAFEVVDRAGGVGVLDEHPEAPRGGLKAAVVADDDVDAEGFRAGADDVDGLRVAGGGDEERGVGVGGAFFEAVTHHHGFGGGGALVEHGAVGDFKTGEVGDEGLKIQNGLEAALGNFGLVRRVGGIPARVFENGALDDAGREGVGVAEADGGAENFILGGEGAEFGEGGALAEGGRERHGTAADVGRHGGVHEGVDGRMAEEREHRGGVGGVVTGVAAGEGVGGGQEVAERGHGEKVQGRAERGPRNRDLGERRRKRGCFAGRSRSVCGA